MEQNLENKESRKEVIEFYIEKGSDYPGFQQMLLNLDPVLFEVNIIAGPSDKYILPGIITIKNGQSKQNFGEKYILEALNDLRKSSKK